MLCSHFYFLQDLNFPIEATFVEEQGKTLSDGMNSINPVEKVRGFLHCEFCPTVCNLGDDDIVRHKVS